MKCYECGGTYREIEGNLEVVDDYVGPVLVQSICYYRCDDCGEFLFSPETAQAIERRRNERRDELLRNQPLHAFLTAAETASILSISRQALHKHRRIRRGFIHQTTFGGNVVYLKESVMLFKVTGDGRLPLYPAVEFLGIKYVEHPVSSDLSSEYEDQFAQTVPLAEEAFRALHQTSADKDVYHAVKQ